MEQVYQYIAFTKYLKVFEFSYKKGRIMEANNLFVSSATMSPNMRDLGIVTGYGVIDTGIATKVCSFFTKIIGSNSDAYMNKIKEAELSAMNMLKEEAKKIGAVAIYDCKINITEATNGQGKLILYAFGTAAKPQYLSDRIANKASS